MPVTKRAFLAITAALVTLAGAGACVRQAEPIAWSDEPADRPVAQETSKPVPRPVEPPCQASDLDSIWPDHGLTFSDNAKGSDATGLAVVVRNIGPATCTLYGHAKVQATDNEGKPVGQPAEPGTYLRAVDLGYHPAVIAPGESAKMLLSTASNGCSGPDVDVRGAEVTLDNGYRFSLKNAWLRGSCRLRVSPWGEFDSRPVRLRALEATLLSPPAVKAGTELVYTVELINVTAAHVSLEPCPVFTQVLTLEDRVEPRDLDRHYHRTHRLNCSVKEVAPRGALRYQMKLPVPQTFPAGKVHVYWFVEDGSHPAAMTATNVTR